MKVYRYDNPKKYADIQWIISCSVQKFKSDSIRFFADNRVDNGFHMISLPWYEVPTDVSKYQVSSDDLPSKYKHELINELFQNSVFFLTFRVIVTRG